jgi:hypothetical protein
MQRTNHRKLEKVQYSLLIWTNSLWTQNHRELLRSINEGQTLTIKQSKIDGKRSQFSPKWNQLCVYPMSLRLHTMQRTTNKSSSSLISSSINSNKNEFTVSGANETILAPTRTRFRCTQSTNTYHTNVATVRSRVHDWVSHGLHLSSFDRGTGTFTINCRRCNCGPVRIWIPGFVLE